MSNDEILKQVIPTECIWDEEHNAPGEWKLVNTPSEYVREAMKQARIETIKQCAERAEARIGRTENGDILFVDIDQQSILSLIDEI